MEKAGKSLLQNWQSAQKGEKCYWLKIIKNKEYLNKHANDFKRSIASFSEELTKCSLFLNSNSNILQIGCGLFDIIDFLEDGKKYAIEPLENYFVSLNDPHRDPNVQRKQGVAEKLPFENDMMDLVISHNMLDHVSSPSKVLSECNRVLKKNGIMWLSIHIYCVWGVFVKKIILNLKIDKKHLFFWTKSSIKELLMNEKYIICKEKIQIEREDIISNNGVNWKYLTKKVLGISTAKYILYLKPIKL